MIERLILDFVTGMNSAYGIAPVSIRVPDSIYLRLQNEIESKSLYNIGTMDPFTPLARMRMFHHTGYTDIVRHTTLEEYLDRSMSLLIDGEICT